MDSITIDIDIKEVMDNFDTLLNTRQQRSVIVASKRAAGNVIRKRAASKVKERHFESGALYRSLKTAKHGLKVTSRHKNVYVVAGLSDEDPFYARFVEMGHGGPRPAPPKEFMSESAQETEKEVIRVFRDKFIEGVSRQMRRRRV